MRRSLVALVSLTLISSAGCGDDGAAVPDAAVADAAIDAPPADAAPPDARQAALACLGDPDPVTADDPISLAASANAIGLGGATPVAGATIDAQLRADPEGTPEATGVTDANGDAILTLVTGAVPVDGFIRVTPVDTYLTTELFPPAVLAADSPAPGLVVEQQTIDLLGIASGNSQNAANGFGLVVLLDCDQVPIANAVITAPSGTVVYAGSDGRPDNSLTATSEIGLAFVFNVTPGDDLVFDADVMGMSLQDNTVRAVAGQVLVVAIGP